MISYGYSVISYKYTLLPNLKNKNILFLKIVQFFFHACAETQMITVPQTWISSTAAKSIVSQVKVNAYLPKISNNLANIVINW